MWRRYANLGILVTAVIIIAAALATTLQQQTANAFIDPTSGFSHERAPMATSGDKNVYVAWWSNKTGNDEVMFKASADAGKTFGNKINLSNSPKSDSQDAQIAAAGNNVYVTWWERNQTMNEPVMKVSNDNGKTFGEKIMLSNNATTAKPLP
jgi:hypothetical protein